MNKLGAMNNKALLTFEDEDNEEEACLPSALKLLPRREKATKLMISEEKLSKLKERRLK